MPRAVDEWFGGTNGAISTRVKLRVFDLANGCCANCGNKIATKAAEFDHIIALVNGGENRESNIQVLCNLCHKGKTKKDVAIKAKTAKIKAKHLGIKRKSNWGNPNLKKKLNGEVVKR